jgi:SAM-dependent methyltransferase
MSGADHRLRTDCRLCGEFRLSVVLRLPSTPLANELPYSRLRPGAQAEFPLYLSQCDGCGHVQLPVVVDPVRLFREYVYVSGTSPVFREHFRHYADSLIERHALGRDDLVVEIGSNDGTLLRFLAERGPRVLGVDPAVDIAMRASLDGVPTLPSFFDAHVAAQIVESHGRAKAVVANNVFAHADDLAGMVDAARAVLVPGGAFVFEVSYLCDVLRHTLFDTIYHEHLSYHALAPLIGFFARRGMSVYHADCVDTHGGSIRVDVRNEPGMGLGAEGLLLLGRERAFFSSERDSFARLERDIARKRHALSKYLEERRGGGVVGYGAPAKATTLLRAFGVEHMFDFVVDDSEHKQGRWLPGGQTPIRPTAALFDAKPRAVVILAWNFAESIAKKLRAEGYGGEIVSPLPSLHMFA